MSFTPSSGGMPSAQSGGIFGGIGDIIGGVGSLQQGKEEKALGEYNAKVYEEQAKSSRKSQEILEVQKRKIIKSRIGEQTAQYAAGGIKMSGSPLEVALDSYTNGEFDIAVDRYNSEVSARAFESQAAQSREAGKRAAKKSKINAAGSFLSGAFKIGSSIATMGAG